MYGFFRFNSIIEGFIFIAVLSVILAITLFYDYQRKKLERMQKDINVLISNIEIFTKHKI